MILGRHPDGGPALAVLIFAFDQHARHGLGAGIEDTHAVVGELQPGDIFLILAEVLAQRAIQRVDRTVAFRRRDHVVIVDLDLDHRHGDGDALADGVIALLDVDVELSDVEIIRHRTERAPGQQLERGIRRFVGVAEGLAFLDEFQQPPDARIVFVGLDADAFEFGQHIGFAGLLRQPAPCACCRRPPARCARRFAGSLAMAEA